MLNHIHFNSIDSTSTYARNNCENASLPLLITADSQFAGRGRRGNTFYSPDKTGLFRTGRLVTTVCQIRMLPKGTLFGYGGTFKVKSEMPVAIVAGGPWSGVVSPRFRQIFLKHYNTAQFGDKRLPIIGSDGDGQTVLDVTGVDIQPGDTVIIDINPLELNPSIKKVII